MLLHQSSGLCVFCQWCIAFWASVLMVHREPWLKSRVPDSALSNVEGRRSVGASKTSALENCILDLSKALRRKNMDNLRVQVVEELGAAGGRSRADDHGRGVGSADTVPGETQKCDSIFGKTEMPMLMVGFSAWTPSPKIKLECTFDKDSESLDCTCTLACIHRMDKIGLSSTGDEGLGDDDTLTWPLFGTSLPLLSVMLGSTANFVSLRRLLEEIHT